MNPVRFQTPLHVFLILLVGLLALGPGSASLPLIDRDEPRFARAAVEMKQTDNWLIPSFNGQARFDKPPLIYAFIRGSMAIWGENEMGARSATIFFTLMVALVLYFFCREWLSSASALLAALAWLTCLQVWIHGRLCLADMPMVFSVILAQWALWRHLRQREAPSWGWTLLLYSALALGFAAKGPIALAVPLLTGVLWFFFSRQNRIPLGQLRLLPGLLLLLGLTAAWGIPVLWSTDGAFWKVGMGDHVIKRGLSPFNGRFPLPFYYVITIWLSLLPWAAFLPVVYRHVRAHWDPRTTFLVAWFLAPILIFSFYATQLPHYILPGLTAFFVLLGCWWETTGRQTRTCGTFPWVYLGIGLVLVVGLLTVLWRFEGHFPGMGPVIFGLAILVLGLLLLPLLTLQQRWKAWGIPLLLIAAGSHLIGVSLRPLIPAAILSDLWKQLPEQAILSGYRYQEPSLVFYSGHPWEWLGKEDLLQPSDGNRPSVTVYQIRERNLFTLREKNFTTPAPGTVVGVHQRTLEGFNPARFTWVELRVDVQGISMPPTPPLLRP